MSSDEKEQKGATRREFVKTAALGAAAVAGAGVLAACTGPAGPAGPAGVGVQGPAGPAGPIAVPPTPQVVVKEVQVQLQKAMGYIEYNPANCAGCLTCMAMCSLYHEGVVQPDMARIQINAPILKIFEAEGITCKQCNEPNCLQSCPLQAISVDAKTGARVIDPQKCKGLQLCIKACPQYPNSPIRYDAARKIAIKCDLCGGDPQCVKFCPKSVALTPHLYPEKDRVLKFVKTL